MPMAQGVVDVAVPTGTPQPFTYDAIDWLPSHGRSVLLRLREARKDGHAAYMRLFDELENARTDAARLEQRLRQLRGEQYRLKDDDPRVTDLREQIERKRAEIARLAERQRQIGDQQQQLIGLVESCQRHIVAAVGQRGWVFQHRGGKTLPEHKQPPPRLARGGGIAEAIEQVRQRVADLKSTLAAIEAAPVPLAERREKIRTTVADLARRGAPSIDPNGAITWPMAMLEAAVHLPPAPEIKSEPAPEPEPQYGRRAAIMWDKIINTTNAGINRFEGGDSLPKRNDATGAAFGPDVLSLFAWLHGDAIIARLESSLPRDIKGALTQAERAQRRQETQAELLSAERHECSLVEAAIDAGFITTFRRDCDPRAVLGLA
jgi:hypothetical protein